MQKVQKSLFALLILTIAIISFFIVKNEIFAMPPLPKVVIEEEYPFEVKLPEYAPFEATEGIAEKRVKQVEGTTITAPLLVNYLSVKEGTPYQVLQIEAGRAEEYNIERFSHVRKGEQIEILDDITAYYDFDETVQLLTWQDGDVIYNIRLFYQMEPIDGDTGFTKIDILNIANSFKPYKK